MYTRNFHVEDAQAKKRLINYLAEDASRPALALAAILSACRLEDPCHSGACRSCGRTFQRAASNFAETIRARAPRGRMMAITIVPGAGCAAWGDLTVETCAGVADAIQGALRAESIGPALLYLDVSFNEDLTGEVMPHWSVHAHGLAADWLSPAQIQGLRLAFPRTDLVSRPVKTELLDREQAGLLYPFKPERNRRETYLDQRDGDDREPCRNTRKRLLRPAQAVELALIEHSVGLLGRLIGIGISAEAIGEALGAFDEARSGL
jgi:hypothetical protein